MDIEKTRRKELLAELYAHFDCYEEVPLRPGLLDRQLIVADVVALPKDDAFSGVLLAFEVKEPRSPWNYARWCRAIRQAADYVFAEADPNTSPASIRGRRVVASFLYPAPPFDPTGQRGQSSFVKAGEEMMVSGALHLGLHFRVGRASRTASRFGPVFTLNFSPNVVWQSDRGFVPQARGLLLGSRALGSGRINALAELPPTVS